MSYIHTASVHALNDNAMQCRNSKEDVFQFLPAVKQTFAVSPGKIPAILYSVFHLFQSHLTH